MPGIRGTGKREVGVIIKGGVLVMVELIYRLWREIHRPTHRIKFQITKYAQTYTKMNICRSGKFD